MFKKSKARPQSNLEWLRSLSVNELAQVISEFSDRDMLPWVEHFNNSYCNGCPGEFVNGQEFAYCERHGNCRYFKSQDDIPSDMTMAAMWLHAPHNNDEENEQ